MISDGVYYEEHGSGAPILCIHGAGSSALLWAEAVEKLAQLGRVIAYDRPEPYERTRVADHADDAAALLDALDAAPAVVIGRSYGGTVAMDLALRYPDRVRALAVLEGDAPRELAPGTAAWLDALADRLDEAELPGELLIDAIYEPGTWAAIPDELREPTEALAAVLPNAKLARVSGGHMIDPASPEVTAARRSV